VTNFDQRRCSNRCTSQKKNYFTPSSFKFVVPCVVFDGVVPCLYKREMARETDQHESVENTGFIQKNLITKTILEWNGVRRKEVRVFGQGDQVFVNQSCPVNRCEIVTSRTERPIEKVCCNKKMTESISLTINVVNTYNLPV
jgi:hypothetical protein